MKAYKFLSIILLIIYVNPGFSQNGQKPIVLNSGDKIGLCLSGGGAKGLAHIGLLKLIDSLGIKIDFITGTSMGSVIGGLYAAGYTGKEIDSLARTADWDIILSQYVEANQINMDEKDEYTKYIAEIPFHNKRFNFTGIIDGQELQNLFTRLTHHVNNVKDFSKLPIPYKCMAVDILTMQPVVLDTGNLALAMRSSMSIPTVFRPIKWGQHLLIDGGLMVNFPVRQLKAMGADFIIGSYTGGRLFDEKEMNTINKLLIQSSSFYGINEAEEDIALCNIFNNLTKNMVEFDAGDFKFASQIINRGIEVSKKALPELVQLAGQYEKLHGKYHNPYIRLDNQSIRVNEVMIDGIESESLRLFLLKRIPLNPGDSANLDQLDEMLIDAFSNRYLSKVYYTVEPMANGTSNIIFHALPSYKLAFKSSIHYDTELGAGIVLNFTARNWAMENSRLVLSVDLSESPKYLLNYRKYLFASRFSWYTSFISETLKQRSYDEQGDLEATYKSNFNNVTTGISYNFNVPSSLFLGIFGETNFFKPTLTESIPNKINIRKIKSKVVGASLNYTLNTLNSLFYPKKGISFTFENRLALQTLDYINGDYITIDSLSPVTKKLELNQAYTPSNRIHLSIIQFIKINHKNSIFYSFNSGLLFTGFTKLLFKVGDNVVVDNENSGITELFQVGGQEFNTRSSYISNIGLKVGELAAQSYTTFTLGYQYEVIQKLFLQPFINFVYSGNNNEAFFKNWNYAFDFNEKTVYSSQYTNLINYGMNIRFKTVLGPINFSVTKINRYDKLRFYLSIGYRF